VVDDGEGDEAVSSELLADVPAKWWTPDPSIVAKLPRGGNGEPKSCNVCGGYHKAGAVHLDYVGHADLTRALIEIDPLWDWEPLAFTDAGLPLISERKTQLVLWGRMRLLGTSRLCVGSCDVGKSDAEKELIGDLLRNGGMRFGVFGSLWSKTDGWDEPATTTPPKATKPRSESPVAPTLNLEQKKAFRGWFDGLPDDAATTAKVFFKTRFGKLDDVAASEWPRVEAFMAGEE